MPVYATMDVGSNSVKLRVEELGSDGGWRLRDDRQDITRLGEELQSRGIIGEAAAARTLAVIGDFAERARRLGASEIAAVGTMCLRRAANTADFVQRVRQACGLQIEIISGEEEARLAHLGVVTGLGSRPGRLAVFDIGGGSTEFIFGEGTAIQERFSLEVGAIRLTDDFCRSDPVTPEERDRLLAAVDRELGSLRGLGPADLLVGIGGTVTNLSAIQQSLAAYDPERVEGSTLTRDQMAALLELLRSKTLAERRRVVGLEPKRADVILAGTVLALQIMDHLGCPVLTVSDRGLRHGLMHERFRSRQAG
jgi:exopolyphosphatase/guanosine-5'-triphosphate,3'-diphosphate pyrophosphatase